MLFGPSFQLQVKSPTNSATIRAGNSDKVLSYWLYFVYDKPFFGWLTFTKAHKLMGEILTAVQRCFVVVYIGLLSNEANVANSRPNGLA